jgi:hypothetical protein
MASNSLHRVAIYGRVSTINHGQDVTTQTRELEQFAQARGWHLVDSYLDIGISGSKDKRPQLDRLMTDAHRRKFDVVIASPKCGSGKSCGRVLVRNPSLATDVRLRQKASQREGTAASQLLINAVISMGGCNTKLRPAWH